ncbi:MAG: Slp family lipoprotein [Desulfobacteraceae bacterium]|jgi:outer membrane lipoprotein
MNVDHGRSALFLLMAVFLAACGGGISRQARDQVTYTGSFAELQQAPADYRGAMVLLGGRVIETLTKAGATELVVLQLDLGSRDRPLDNDQSQGRFLVRSARFIDPAIFPPGTLITVVGRLRGSETRPIGEMPYTYPLIEPAEMKKWPAGGDASPRFHFGIGIGTHF